MGCNTREENAAETARGEEIHWEFSYLYLVGHVKVADLMKVLRSQTYEETTTALQELANAYMKKPRELEFEAYTDEIHVFFNQGKKRVRFANLQAA